MKLSPKSKLIIFIIISFALLMWVMGQLKPRGRVIKEGPKIEKEIDRKIQLKKQLEAELNKAAREHKPPLTPDSELEPQFVTPDPGILSTDPRMP